jgi:hypothetical protein
VRSTTSPTSTPSRLRCSNAASNAKLPCARPVCRRYRNRTTTGEIPHQLSAGLRSAPISARNAASRVPARSARKDHPDDDTAIECNASGIDTTHHSALRYGAGRDNSVG